MVTMYNNWTLLQVLLLALVCLTKLSCGFNAATSLPSSVHVAPSSILTSKTSTPYNRWGEESTKKCTLQLKAHSTTHHHHDVGNPYHISSSGSSLRSSGLFPARQQQHHHAMHTTSRLQMTTTPENNNNDISSSSDNNTNNPLVRIWLKLRVFMARLWRLILKPFQLLKSIVTKKSDGDDEVTATKETEPIQEDVAITQVENLAIDEEVTKEEVADDDDTTTLVEEEEEAPVDEVDVEETKVEEVTTPGKTITPTTTTTSAAPEERQATASVDFTGNWTLLVDDSFKSEYDSYLRKLGQPMLVRTVAMTVIGSTKEEAIQSEGGKQLFIRGMNVRGSWERTLEASESDAVEEEGSMHAVEGHVLKPMVTADEEEVEVASWWEDGGKVHRSWVVGGKKYGGGDFENKRYLSDNGNMLVCESTFHPSEEGREKATVTWRFLREGAIYGDAGFDFPNIFDVLKKEKESVDSSKEEIPESGLVVGDIMDSVASSEEADGLVSREDAISDSIEEAIERGSWVPPSGDHWAISAPEVDLSGKWKLIITEQFKEDYDEFLKALGQPLIVRGAALLIVGNTREETKQRDGGREVYIKGINAKGVWERTLKSSGSDFDTTMTPNADGSYDHTPVKILTADSEKVDATSWWENDGTVHVSWTQGVNRYGGGSFESRRYLENNGDIYVCESIFRRDNKADGPDPSLKWKFLREGATFYVGSSK